MDERVFNIHVNGFVTDKSHPEEVVTDFVERIQEGDEFEFEVTPNKSQPPLTPSATDREIAALAIDAVEAFWDHVARRFPGVKTGDFPVLDTARQLQEAERYIKAWLESNSQEKGD